MSKGLNLSGKKIIAALSSFWFRYASEGRVIIAVSGGVDSMVLLEGLLRLVKDAQSRRRFLVAHVNHALRGKESDEDEALVGAYARKQGVDVRSLRIDWESHRPTQALCREKRDAFFLSLCEGSKDTIWLAHHLNDQAETVFLRLLRGSGARGLRGMLPKNGRKLRPFLDLEKTELISAAREWGIQWREDGSNQDLEHYERNWVRGVFPILEARRPGFQTRLAALAEEARGWQLSKPLSLFFPELEDEGISLLRPDGIPSTGHLSQAYRLSRANSKSLQNLFLKPTGALHVEGARFSWSCGILLCERGKSFSSVLTEEREAGLSLSGALGRWSLPISSEFWKDSSGEKKKKEFQQLRVPLFFRLGIPVLNAKGKPRALLPGRIEAFPGIRYTPSRLARWWLARDEKNL